MESVAVKYSHAKARLIFSTGHTSSAMPEISACDLTEACVGEYTGPTVELTALLAPPFPSRLILRATNGDSAGENMDNS